MNHSVFLVINLYKFSKTTAIVIMSGLGITKSFENWTSAQYSLFDTATMRALLTECSQMMQKKIRRFRLTGSTLAAYDDALIFLLLEHTMISGVGDGEYMRRYVWPQSTILIKLHVFWIVYRIKFEGIQSD